PDGSRVYVTYNAFTTPFSTTTATPRMEHGVLRSAAIGAGGAPGAFSTEFVGASGDARGTSQGRILYNEFLGDYVYAIATRTYGGGVGPAAPHRARRPGHGRLAAGPLHRRSSGVPGSVAARGLPGELRQQRHLQRDDRALAENMTPGEGEGPPPRPVAAWSLSRSVKSRR